MTKIIAHRGASAKAPENTIPAFELARDLGADAIELDVQLTSDGEVVVIHDHKVDRTTDGQGEVAAMSLDQLKSLDASAGRSGFAKVTIPTLEEVFTALADSSLTINIEIKEGAIPRVGLAERVLAIIDQRDWEYRVAISSFNHMTLARIRQGGSLINTGVLFSDILFEPWNYAHQLWATALHPPFAYVDAVSDLLAESHNSLLEVNVWTVDAVDDIDRMLARGVDGIITDHPDLAVERRRLFEG
ncbi:MAG: glycerophosphodiester phosphodiesterase [Propionibacteriaceae bacterium]|nr:glycerophosphodiester phosphodiesterase [Propionibacteriaceae bacterium]